MNMPITADCMESAQASSYLEKNKYILLARVIGLHKNLNKLTMLKNCFFYCKASALKSTGYLREVQHYLPVSFMLCCA